MDEPRQLPAGTADIDLLIDAARQAGKAAMTFFRDDVEVWWKNEGTSPVTAADHAANAVIEATLLGARPSYGWLSEESEDGPTRLLRDDVFIVDPIDGTRAFMNGKNTWVVSVAVARNGKPVAGVLFAPALEELYVATADGAVSKNNRAVQVAETDAAQRLRISAADDMIARLPADVRSRIDRQGSIPSLAYRLAMIADGRLDATIVKPNAHDWDLAAADIILRNAGGRLTDLAGNDLVYNLPVPTHGILIAASNRAHGQMLAAFARA